MRLRQLAGPARLSVILWLLWLDIRGLCSKSGEGMGRWSSMETEAIPDGVGSPSSAGLEGERTVKVLQAVFWGAGDPL